MHSYMQDEAYRIVEKYLQAHGESLDPYMQTRAVEIVRTYINAPFSIRTLSQEPYGVFLGAFIRRTIYEIKMFFWNYVIMV